MIIKETEGILIKDTRFHLPGKKSLLKEENHFEVALWLMSRKVLLNVLKKTEVELFGQKKCHTQKMQIIADKSGRKILCTAIDKGRKHDFRLFKNSRVYLQEASVCLADTGYQGLLKLHKNSE